MKYHWFRLMVWIDEYLIHPWWDKIAGDTVLDEKLCRFCMYAWAGHWDYVWSRNMEE